MDGCDAEKGTSGPEFANSFPQNKIQEDSTSIIKIDDSTDSRNCTPEKKWQPEFTSHLSENNIQEDSSSVIKMDGFDDSPKDSSLDVVINACDVPKSITFGTKTEGNFSEKNTQTGHDDTQHNKVGITLEDDSLLDRILFSIFGCIINICGDPDGTESAYSFSERNIRRGFLQKVYGIMLAKFAGTFSLICLYVYWMPLHAILYGNIGLGLTLSALFYILLVILVVCQCVRRNYPSNLICLILYTMHEAYFLGTFSVVLQAHGFLWIFGMCIFLFCGLTAFSFQTMYDFTSVTGVLVVSILVLIGFGFLVIILPEMIKEHAFLCLEILIYGFYIVFDTQKIMAGEHFFSFTPEEYYFAAISLYFDICNWFVLAVILWNSDCVQSCFYTLKSMCYFAPNRAKRLTLLKGDSLLQSQNVE